jgi:hypothetical protein
LKALITETNAAPSLALAHTTTSLAEGTYADPVKIANITVTDDGVGTKNLTLSGADKDLFFISIDGTELFLKAGTVLDFEGGNTTLDVTVGGMTRRWTSAPRMTARRCRSASLMSWVSP